jgi:hypothetical protein
MNGSLSQLPSPSCCPSRKARIEAISDPREGSVARARLAVAELRSSPGPLGPKLPLAFRWFLRKVAPAFTCGSMKNRVR